MPNYQTLESFCQYAHNLDSTPKFRFKGGRVTWEGVDYPRNATGETIIVSKMVFLNGWFGIHSAYRRANALVEILPGTEEGDPCQREGCGGTMEFKRVEQCYCHINPPCSACENAPLICTECGFQIDPE